VLGAAALSFSADSTQFVFLIGTGRCGSTRLAEILASHSRIGFVSHIEERLPLMVRGGRWNDAMFRFVSRSAAFAASKNVGHVFSGQKSHAIKRALALAGPSEAFPLLAHEVSPMIAVPCRDLVAEDAVPWVKERFRRFFVVRARKQGKAVFLHKFTGWPRARFVDAVFPSAKFVHLVRDGRAVASSLMQVRFWQGYRGPSEWSFGPLSAAHAREWEDSGRSFALLAGLEWKTLMDAFEEAERAISRDRWLNVRYEDLVEDPRRELHRILAFADLPWTADLERQLTVSPIMRTRERAFLDELGARDVELLNNSLASHLDRWGYSNLEPGA
jgi:hypothetical protein